MTTNEPFLESAVLAPRDPSITNTDDWLEFKLHDTTITLPDKTTPASLLLASERYPLTLFGQLERVPRRQAHTFLLPDRSRTASIAIEDVRSFAYGAYEDGSVDLWAVGKAGWFVIKPSKQYKRIYDEMIAGVKMLFFIVDVYSVSSKKELKVQELFEKYAVEVIGLAKMAPEAAERMYRHRDFLLSSMLAGKEGIAWGDNPLYRHLVKKFPKDLISIRKRLPPPVPAVAAVQSKAMDAPTVESSTQTSLDAASTTGSLKRKRGRPLKDADPPSTSDSLKRKQGRPRKEVVTDVISIGSSSAASSTHKTAPPAALMRTASKSQSAPPAGSTRSKDSQQSFLQTRQNSATSALLSPAETPEASAPTPAQDSDSDDHPRLAHKGRSALRPKASKPSKGPPKSGKAPIVESDDELALRSSPVPTKRKHSNLQTHPSKRRNSKQHELDEGIDIPTSPSSDAAGGAEESDPAALNHRPDPVQEDTWTCALDGCTHKVYAASLPQSQKLIREHYTLHAYDDDERVRLVKLLQAPSLPVGHLMERVRGQARLEGFPGSKVAGSRYPQPIRQRY